MNFTPRKISSRNARLINNRPIYSHGKLKSPWSPSLSKRTTTPRLLLPCRPQPHSSPVHYPRTEAIACSSAQKAIDEAEMRASRAREEHEISTKKMDEQLERSRVRVDVLQLLLFSHVCNLGRSRKQYPRIMTTMVCIF